MLADLLLTFFAFFVAMLFTAIIFGIWILIAIIRIFAHVIRTVTRSLFGLPPVHRIDYQIAHCTRSRCGAPNPVEAKFCRRCGQRLEKPQHVQVHRAAPAY